MGPWMIVLSILAGIAVYALIGLASVYCAQRFDRKHFFLDGSETDGMMTAILWPIVWVVAAFVIPSRLYWTYGVKGIVERAKRDAAKDREMEEPPT